MCYFMMFTIPVAMEKVDERPKEVLVQDHLLVTLESAYPNILPMEDLAKYVPSLWLWHLCASRTTSCKNSVERYTE